MRKGVLLITVGVLSSLASAEVNFQPVKFSELPAWQQNNFQKSYEAFYKSCLVLTSRKRYGSLSSKIIKLNGHWHQVCNMAKKKKHLNHQQAKQFFERHFQAYRMTRDDKEQGLITGYYLPEVKASLKKTRYYQVPLYARPSNLVTVRLGWFKQAWKNEKLVGRLVNGRLYPFSMSRAKINAGGLRGKTKVLAYVHSRVNRFFLQIQGSGVLKLTNGHRMVVGYNGENGCQYFPIGRWFVKSNIFTFKTISMQGIKRWLAAHPSKVNRILNMNHSFIFFRITPNNLVYGTDAIPLTSGYSLAVDSSEIPLGLPIFIASDDFKRLMVSQDTGGAIRGALRGDVYFGSGLTAEKRAGHLKDQAAFYVLMPK